MGQWRVRAVRLAAGRAQRYFSVKVVASGSVTSRCMSRRVTLTVYFPGGSPGSPRKVTTGALRRIL